MSESRRQGGLGHLLEQLRDGGMGTALARGASGSFAVSMALVGIQSFQHLLLARWLGTDEYGIYVFFLVWINVLSMLARLGLDSGQVRFVAEYRVAEGWGPLRGLLRRSDQIVLGASVALGALAAGVVALLHGRLGPSEEKTSLVACALLPLVALLGLRRGALQGLRRVVASRMTEALQRLVTLGAVLAIFLWLHHTVTAPMAMFCLLAATAVVLAGSHLWMRRALPRDLEAEPARFETRSWLRTSLPLLLVSGMRQLLNETDVLLVGMLVGRTEAGVYFIASRLSRLVSAGLEAANYMAAPLIAECESQGRRGELQRLATLTAWGATVTSAVFALGLILGRSVILNFVGEGFEAGSTVLVLLLIGQLVNAVTGPVGNLLNMTGHQDVNARILAVVVGLNLVLNYPAILYFGIEGAAVVTSALVAAKNLWTWWVVYHLMGVNSSIFGRLKASA